MLPRLRQICFVELTHAFRANVLLIALCVMALGSSAVAQTVHEADADPTSEGWSISPVGTIPTSTPLSPDPLYPWISAWSIERIGGGEDYRIDGPAVGVAWSLTAEVRVANLNDANDVNVHVMVGNGTRRWLMSFGSLANGDTTVSVEYALGVGSNLVVTVPTRFPNQTEYVRVDMVHDPISNTTEAFVDGSSVATSWQGRTIAQDLVAFGDGSTPGSGRGHWRRVVYNGTAACVNGMGEDAIPTAISGSGFFA